MNNTDDLSKMGSSFQSAQIVVLELELSRPQGLRRIDTMVLTNHYETRVVIYYWKDMILLWEKPANAVLGMVWRYFDIKYFATHNHRRKEEFQHYLRLCDLHKHPLISEDMENDTESSE